MSESRRPEVKRVWGLPKGYELELARSSEGPEYGTMTVVEGDAKAPVALLRWDPPNPWRPERGPRLTVLGPDSRPPSEIRHLLVAVHFLALMATSYRESFPASVPVLKTDGTVVEVTPDA